MPIEIARVPPAAPRALAPVRGRNVYGAICDARERLWDVGWLAPGAGGDLERAVGDGDDVGAGRTVTLSTRGPRESSGALRASARPACAWNHRLLDLVVDDDGARWRGRMLTYRLSSETRRPPRRRKAWSQSACCQTARSSSPQWRRTLNRPPASWNGRWDAQPWPTDGRDVVVHVDSGVANGAVVPAAALIADRAAGARVP